MNKSILAIGIVIVVAVAGGAYVFMAKPKEVAVQKDESSMGNDSVMMKKDDMAMEKDDAMMMKTSVYMHYSPEAFAAATNSKRVLFFYANWCPTCIPTDKDLMENSSQIPADVKVFRVNYKDPDTDAAETELAKTYGVTYQHTFVQVDSAGAVVTKWNGGKTAELVTNIK